MTSALLCWLVFPLLLASLSFGTGLLLQQLAGVVIPRPLLVPAGFAALCAVVNFATASDRTAEIAAPASIGVAVIGLGLALPLRPAFRDCWPAAVAVLTYTAFLLPVLTSGKPTFAGYIRLDDTSTWLAMTDWMLEHGRSMSNLVPSTYEAVLDGYVASGAPAGAFLPLGVGAVLIGEDSAFVFQPYTAFVAAMLGLSLYGLLTRLVESHALRAFAAVVGAQPAIYYGFSLWGGIKEVASGAFVALAAALVPLTLQHVRSARALLPLAVVCSAELGAVSLGGAAWLVVPLAVLLVLAFIRLGLRALSAAAAFIALLAVLALPTIVVSASFVRRIEENDVLRRADELGNLIEPLRWLQVIGIWPTGDFRLEPPDLTTTYVLLAAAVVGVAAGAGIALRRRAWEVPLSLATAGVGLVAVALYGSPWVDAKAIATASPPVLAVCCGGIAAVFTSGRRVEASVLALAVVGGVAWSNGLAFREAVLAPYDRHRELEAIGARFAGEGPALMTEYEQYGVRHFLRRLDPEGAGSLRRRTIPLRSGGFLEKGGYADIDDFRLDAVLVYRTLVLRRSPVGSRPPSVYTRVWRGVFYDVWQRPEPPRATIVVHHSFGAESPPSTRPACRNVRRVAAAAGAGHLAAVVRERPQIVALSTLPLPRGWRPGADGTAVPARSGTLEAALQVPRRGRYDVWIAGSFKGRLLVRINGVRVGTQEHQLNWPGHWTPFGGRILDSGRHRVTLEYGASRFVGGSGGAPYGLGPLAVAAADGGTAVTTVSISETQRLCGRQLDWIEALR